MWSSRMFLGTFHFEDFERQIKFSGKPPPLDKISLFCLAWVKAIRNSSKRGLALPEFQMRVNCSRGWGRSRYCYCEADPLNQASALPLATTDESKGHTVCFQAGRAIQEGLIRSGQVGIGFHEVLAVSVPAVRGRLKHSQKPASPLWGVRLGLSPSPGNLNWQQPAGWLEPRRGLFQCQR